MFQARNDCRDRHRGLNELEEAKQKALLIIANGDVVAAKQALEELVAYGEDTLDSMQETYDMHREFCVIASIAQGDASIR